MHSITMHHNALPKRNWQKTTEQTKKPWFCKAFQVGTCYHAKDHENNGKTHRHIRAYCLAQGRILTHPEKDCLFAKNQMSQKMIKWLLSRIRAGQLACVKCIT